MELYGELWSRREIEARIGRTTQIGGLRSFTLRDGPEAGVQQIELRTGAGLRALITPQRGLDLGLTTFADVPLSWQAPAGEAHPAFYDAQGAGWLRTAAGGWLMTCGLSYVGAPGEDEGVAYGLHGRIHHIPARQVVAEERWQEDTCHLRVAGVLEEAAMFGEYLRLTREIRAEVGRNWLEIEDVVENLAFAPAPHMILYHFNFGWPLLAPAMTLHFPSTMVQPREASTPLTGYDRWQLPQPGYAERVYYHTLPPVAPVSVTLRNPQFPLPGGPRPLQVRLGWDSAELPHLIQWKMPGAGLHVLGLEPSNCHVEGRAAERARGTLVTLAPGEQRRYRLRLEVTVG